MLARALAQQPKVLLLDEPTSALDIRNQYQVLKLVRDICHEDHIIAAMVIHDLNLALRFCDRFLLLKDGVVYRCGDRSILDSEALKEVYGVDAEIVLVEGRHMVLVKE
jgi:iron complex transport system ATP-binding protein